MKDNKVRVWWRNLHKKGKRGISARQSHTANVRRELRTEQRPTGGPQSGVVTVCKTCKNPYECVVHGCVQMREDL